MSGINTAVRCQNGSHVTHNRKH